MANRNYSNGGKIYAMRTSPVFIDCNFIVNNAVTGGIASLNGPTVSAVYMNTSASASSTNPAAGTILVRLQDNYNSIVGIEHDIVTPNSGSDVKIDNSAMTAGVAYTITTLGNATAAKWLAIGVPAGITPAVGVTFIAATTGGAGNTLTSRVQAATATGSGIASIEGVGTQSLLLAPSPSSLQGYGSSFILQCRDYAGSLAAPANGSMIRLRFYLNNSSVD